MGYVKSRLDWVTNNVEKVFTGGATGLEMLELGDMEIGDPQIKEKVAADYYKNLGFEYTSFDLNGRNGAIRVDLGDLQAKEDWLACFDVVTNMGTLEHLEPISNQYNGFANAHNWTKVGGLMFHSMPDVPSAVGSNKWLHHCSYFYGELFFRNLAEKNNYEIVDAFQEDGLRCTCLVKLGDRPFMQDTGELQSWIYSDYSGGTTIYPGINKKDKLFGLQGRLDNWIYYTRETRKKVGLTKSSFKEILFKKKDNKMK